MHREISKGNLKTITISRTPTGKYYISFLTNDGEKLPEKLAQIISDSAWYSFVLKLTYKAEWVGKTILKIGMFEPSSKTCNVCGYKLKELSLDIREWQCPDCKNTHDRDINAAINIKKIAVGTTV